MMKEKYETLPLTTLKELAKARGLKGISTMKKAQVIELMLQEDEKEQEKEKQEAAEEKIKADEQTEKKIKEDTKEKNKEKEKEAFKICLEKIRKLTGLDLRNFDDAIVFKVALMVKKYLSANPAKY